MSPDHTDRPPNPAFERTCRKRRGTPLNLSGLGRQTMTYSVRRAVNADAKPACLTVRRSIAELCMDDHHGDEHTLAEWLANKTPSKFEAWIESDRHVAIVAEDTRGVAGFGLLNRDGRLALLYVSPEARFQGVSKALLCALEAEARRSGIRELCVNSSLTAKRFYAARGYRCIGAPCKGFGVTQCYPMSKSLTR